MRKSQVRKALIEWVNEDILLLENADDEELALRRVRYQKALALYKRGDSKRLVTLLKKDRADLRRLSELTTTTVRTQFGKFVAQFMKEFLQEEGEAIDSFLALLKQKRPT